MSKTAKQDLCHAIAKHYEGRAEKYSMPVDLGEKPGLWEIMGECYRKHCVEEFFEEASYYRGLARSTLVLFFTRTTTLQRELDRLHYWFGHI